jgi:hypothetical protein
MATRRLLVVANETVASKTISRHIDADTDVLVIAPALNTRLRFWSGDDRRRLASRRGASRVVPPLSRCRRNRSGGLRRGPRSAARDRGRAQAVRRRPHRDLDLPGRALELARARHRGTRPGAFRCARRARTGLSVNRIWGCHVPRSGVGRVALRIDTVVNGSSGSRREVPQPPMRRVARQATDSFCDGPGLPTGPISFG